MNDQVWLWDTWPLTDLQMRPVSVNGWHLIMGLVAPRSIDFGARHPVARIGWFVSRDGESWVYRGELLPDERALGSRQWSGSAILVGDRVHLFYTASGEGLDAGTNWEQTDFVQRIAHASATIHATAEGIGFDQAAFTDNKIVTAGDGQMYQTHEQATGSEIIYGFRDPFVFAEGDEVFMTFTGNQAGPGCFTGNIGLARALDDSLTQWELLPPLLHATGVNQQLERPHFVRENGLHYLFFVTHESTYAPGLSGPDGLYAFVADSMQGQYRPVNGSGVVLASQPGRPPERFADYVMPNWLVEGFIEAVAGRSGGTLAQTVRLEAVGDQIRVAEVLGYAEIPAIVDVLI